MKTFNCSSQPKDVFEIDRDEGRVHIRATHTFMNCFAATTLTPADARLAAVEMIRIANQIDGVIALPASSPVYPQGFSALTDQARKVYQHMKKAGHITARAAMADYGISSGALTKRITDIQRAGFEVKKERARHPIHQRLYTRYSLAEAN